MEPTSAQRSNPVRRGWAATLLFAIGGLVTASGALAVWGSGPGWLAIVLGILAVTFLLIAFLGSGSAACPSCGAHFTQLMPLALERCHRCGRYAEVKQGRIWEIAADRVLQEPQFAIPMPEKFLMPELCCSCGMPATRREEVAIDLAQGASPVIHLGGDIHCTLAVPHCDLHFGGAKLDREVFKKPVSADVLLGTQPAAMPVTVLKVRSYQFYLEFLRLNPGAGSSVDQSPDRPAAS